MTLPASSITVQLPCCVIKAQPEYHPADCNSWCGSWGLAAAAVPSVSPSAYCTHFTNCIRQHLSCCNAYIRGKLKQTSRKQREATKAPAMLSWCCSDECNCGDYILQQVHDPVLIGWLKFLTHLSLAPRPLTAWRLSMVLLQQQGACKKLMLDDNTENAYRRNLYSTKHTMEDPGITWEGVLRSDADCGLGRLGSAFIGTLETLSFASPPAQKAQCMKRTINIAG